MIDKILNLKNTVEIKKEEQKVVHGGSGCAAFKACNPGYHFDLYACECVKSDS